MLWKFKQGNIAKVTAEKIFSMYGEGLISGRVAGNCFSKFPSGDTTLKNERKVGRPSELDDNR